MRKEAIVYRDPKSPISEVFRTLRTNIQYMNTDKRIKTLLITSTMPEEGKSWVSANLSIAFAQAGKNVLLIDADMRKGRQFNIFGLPPRPGLSNFLSKARVDDKGNLTEEIDEYIQLSGVKNLFVLTAGSVPSNPSELLGSAQARSLIKNVRRKFDIVIIDGTPYELVADAIVLSKIVDSTLLVAASNKTKKDALKRVIQNMENVNTNILGVVLNKVSVSNKSYNKKYYYYGNKNNLKSEKPVREIDLSKELENIVKYGNIDNKKGE